MNNKKTLFFSNYFKAKNNYFDFFSLDDLGFFGGQYVDVGNFLTKGLNGISLGRLIESSSGVDYLFRNKNKHYFSLVDSFLSLAKNYDSIVLFDFNFLHPEILNSHYLKNKKKVMAFVDDPYSTFVRGFDYAHFFDSIIYISPTYLDGNLSTNIFRHANLKSLKWFPLVLPDLEYHSFDALMKTKNNSNLIYVGAPTHSKLEKISLVKSVLKHDFEVYGRWRLSGYYGFIAPLFGRSLYPYKVKKLSTNQYRNALLNYRFGLNMYCSDGLAETGNARCYQYAANAVVSIDFIDPSSEHIFPVSSGFYTTDANQIQDILYELRSDSSLVRNKALERFEFFWDNYSPESVYFSLYSWINS